MEEITKIAVDAMGGDNAPGEIVAGVCEALSEASDVEVFLCGREDDIKEALAAYPDAPGDRIHIIEASEIIETGEPPVAAIRKKKDSSLVRALELVKDKSADAFVSAGSTGAILVGGQLIVGKIKGVKRAPLAPLIPTQKGVSLLIDCGANVDPRPEHLLAFAKMGSIYAENALGAARPTVAILNIGAEEEKGNALVKETYPLLKECSDINFIGNIEARDIAAGGADVIVTDAFSGNIALKMYEGVGSALISEIKAGLMSTFISKIGAAMALPALKSTLRKFDASEYGGAPLLGLKGLVVKTHGSAKAKEVKNTILQCRTFKRQQIQLKIENAFMI